MVFSNEGSRVDSDRLSLTTAGIAAVVLNVQGKASHAGSAPERGVNALYELSHQILQMRDLSDPATGLKMNWTVASAGTNRNVIPAIASATADVRVLRVADYDGIEQKVRERIKKQLIPDAKVEMIFERRRPLLETTPGAGAGETWAAHLCRARHEPRHRRRGRGRRHRRGVCRPQDQGTRHRAFRLRGFGSHSNDSNMSRSI